MKPFLFSFSLIVALHFPVVAQTTSASSTPPTPYEKSIKSAREALSIGPRGKPSLAQLKSRYEGAARHYSEAAIHAPDDGKKYDAYLKAANYYSDADMPEKAINAFEQAAAVVSITGAQRAKARLELADATFTSKGELIKQATIAAEVHNLYDAALKTTDIDETTRDAAWRGQARILEKQDEFIKAALLREKVTTSPHSAAYSPLSDYGIVLDYLEKAPQKASPEASALIDRVMPKYLSLVTEASWQTWRAARQLLWGDLQVKFGAPARAYVAWTQLADDTTASYSQRAEAIAKIATQRAAEKQPLLGLKAWERTAGWPEPKAGELKASENNWMLARALSRSEMYSALGQESEARRELVAAKNIAALPPAEIARIDVLTGESHEREIVALKKAPSSTRTLEQIAQHEKAAKSSYETVIKSEGDSFKSVTQAAIKRANMDVAAKQYATALKWITDVSNKFYESPAKLDDRYMFSLAREGAQILYSEKKYGAAAELLLTTAARNNDNSYKEAHKIANQLFSAAFNEKLWNDCRVILKASSINRAQFYHLSLKVEVAAEDWNKAAEVVAASEKEKIVYSGDDLTQFEAWKARIPISEMLKRNIN